MAQALTGIETEPEHTADIAVYVAETPGEKRREYLVAALEEIDGITAAEFCPLRCHLMLVRYDTEMYSAQDVLNRITSLTVNARLIGPV
jgi:hypothetical protein